MLENIIAKIIGFLLWLLNISINSTVRLDTVNEEIIAKTHQQGKKNVFAFWHGLSFSAMYYYRNQKACIMPISSLQGKILANFANKLGYKIAPYPESGTPGKKIQSTKKLLKTIREGYDLTLAVDGPPEPRYHKVNPGVLFFSQKTGFPLVPVGIYYKTKLTCFWRWDKYQIPLPGSRAVMAFGEPFEVPDKLDLVELEKKTKELEEEILKANDQAKQACLQLK